MDEIKFKPNYGIHSSLGVIFILLFGGLLLYLGNKDESIVSMGLSGFFFLLGVFAFFAYPKEIIFTSHQVKVKYLLSAKILEYSDFTDMGGSAIRFGRSAISLVGMKNAGELLSILQKLIDERKIQPAQIQGKLVVEEALTAKALKYSLIPGIILSIVASIVLDTYFQIDVDFRLVSGIVFLVLLFSIYFFMKNKQEME